MGITTSIIAILCIMIIRQLCTSPVQVFDDQNWSRLNRVRQLTVFSILSVFLNVCIYCYSIQGPDAKVFGSLHLFYVTYILELLTMLIGIHLYGLCQLSIINGLQLPINFEVPRCTETIFRKKEYPYSITVIVFYVFILGTPPPDNSAEVDRYTTMVYAVLMSIVMVESMLMVFVLYKIKRILNSADRESMGPNFEWSKWKKARRNIVGSLVVFCMLCLVSFGALALCIQSLLNKLHLNGSEGVKHLVMCIVHSIVLVLFNTALLLWIYKRTRCCTLERGTYCHLCGCIVVVRRASSDDTKQVLLNHSVQSQTTRTGFPDNWQSKATTLNTRKITSTFTKTKSSPKLASPKVDSTYTLLSGGDGSPLSKGGGKEAASAFLQNTLSTMPALCEEHSQNGYDSSQPTSHLP